MKYATYLIILLSNLLFAQSASEKSGAAANLFLRTELSPRATAMAGAFTAVAGDEAVVLYNPGALTQINFFNASFNHTSWYRDIRFEQLILGYKLDRNLALALSVAQLGMPEIMGKDQFGISTHKLEVSSTILNLGLSYRLFRKMNAGLNIKYFQDALAGYESNGAAVDFGLYSSQLLPGLSLGAAIRNVSGKVQYDQTKEHLPLEYRAGLVYDLRPLRTLIALDLVESNDTDLHVNIGAEYRYAGLLSLRIGNRLHQGNLLQLSAGIGFEVLDQVFIDYAFQSNSDLGQVHRFGIAYRLKRPAPSYQKYLNKNKVEAAELVPPIKLKYEIREGKLQIRWQSIPGVQYNVYARADGTKKYIKVNRHALYANQTQFKKPGTAKKLFVVVTSLRGDKESAYSKELKINVR